MPKMKTNRGAVKRFRQTATGFKKRSSYRNHILSKRRMKNKRHLRYSSLVKTCDTKSIARMLCIK